MFTDFRTFILRGNIVDLLIGFTVGAAFSNVAKSFVTDVLMPPVGVILGQSDFSNSFLVIKSGTYPGPYTSLSQAQTANAVTINYGIFFNNVLSLVIVGFAVYILIKVINRMNDQLESLPLLRKKIAKGQEEPSHKKCPFCLSTIPYKASKCSSCTADIIKIQEKK